MENLNWKIHHWIQEFLEATETTLEKRWTQGEHTTISHSQGRHHDFGVNGDQYVSRLSMVVHIPYNQVTLSFRLRLADLSSPHSLTSLLAGRVMRQKRKWAAQSSTHRGPRSRNGFLPDRGRFQFTQKTKKYIFRKFESEVFGSLSQQSRIERRAANQTLRSSCLKISTYGVHDPGFAWVDVLGHCYIMGEFGT